MVFPFQPLIFADGTQADVATKYTVNKSTIGLPFVDNVSDNDKPVSIKAQSALSNIDPSSDNRIVKPYEEANVILSQTWTNYPLFAKKIYDRKPSLFRSLELYMVDDQTLGISNVFGKSVNMVIVMYGGGLNGSNPTCSARIVVNNTELVKKTSWVLASGRTFGYLSVSFNTFDFIEGVGNQSITKVNLQIKYSHTATLSTAKIDGFVAKIEFIPTPFSLKTITLPPKISGLVNFWSMCSVYDSVTKEKMIGKTDTSTDLLEFSVPNTVSSELSVSLFNCNCVLWSGVNYIDKYVVNGANKGWSISFWMKLESFGALQDSIFLLGVSAATWFYAIGRNNTSGVFVGIRNAANNNEYINHITPNSLDWNRYTFTFKLIGTSIEMNFFRNNTKIRTETYTSGSAAYLNLFFTLCEVGPVQTNNSTVKYVSTWDNALTSQDIARLYNWWDYNVNTTVRVQSSYMSDRMLYSNKAVTTLSTVESVISGFKESDPNVVYPNKGNNLSQVIQTSGDSLALTLIGNTTCALTLTSYITAATNGSRLTPGATLTMKMYNDNVVAVTSVTSVPNNDLVFTLSLLNASGGGGNGNIPYGLNTNGVLFADSNYGSGVFRGPIDVENYVDNRVIIAKISSQYSVTVRYNENGKTDEVSENVGMTSYRLLRLGYYRNLDGVLCRGWLKVNTGAVLLKYLFLFFLLLYNYQNSKNRFY